MIAAPIQRIRIAGTPNATCACRGPALRKPVYGRASPAGALTLPILQRGRFGRIRLEAL